MISRAVYKKRRGRRLLTGLAAVSLISGILLTGGSVLAVHEADLFELDVDAGPPVVGDANTANDDVPGDDWEDVYAGTSGAFATTFIGPNEGEFTGAAETSYFTGGGSKDVRDISGKNSWQYGTSNDPIPDKDDIAHAFAAAYVDPDNLHTNIYFGMDRYDNNGDAEAGFWFFKGLVTLGTEPNFNGLHQVGDVLVLINWGGSNPVGEMTVYEWIGNVPGGPLLLVADDLEADCALAAPDDNYCGVANRTTDTPPWPFLDKGGSTDIRPLELLEAGLDLNALFGSDICFSSFMATTRSSHSPTAQLKDFALGGFEQCGASIATQVSETTLFVGETVTDDATITVAGGPNPPAPTGTVSFKVDGFAFDTKPLSGADNVGNDYTVTSVAYTATTTGHHCFSASWLGDSNYTTGPYVDNGTNECFDVVKRPSTTETDATPTGVGVIPGTSVTDTATVTSTSGFGPTPTGTVKFFLCQPATVIANGGDCRAGGTQIGTPLIGEDLNGSGVAASEPSTNTTTIGKYCWRAEYSGDGFYLASSHTNDGTECFTTVKQPSDTTTQSSETGVVLPGTSVTDTATVTGSGPTPTGSVTFFLCQPATVTANSGDCSSGGSQVGAVKPLAGGIATSDAASGANTTTNGKYCWRAVYGGDGYYLGSSHFNSTTECFTVQDTTSATSAQNWLPNDSATITSTGGTALNGTLSFTLYSGGTCDVEGTELRAAETFTLTGASSSATRTTTNGADPNETVTVEEDATVSWLVTFASSDPLVGGSSHCESTVLDITN